MTRKIFVYLILFSISILNARSQTTNYNLPRLAAQNKIKVINREVTTAGNDSISSIHLSSKENGGVAWIDGLEFSNGIIEIDMKGKDILQQSFVVLFMVLMKKRLMWYISGHSIFKAQILYACHMLFNMLLILNIHGPS